MVASQQCASRACACGAAAPALLHSDSPSHHSLFPPRWPELSNPDGGESQGAESGSLSLLSTSALHVPGPRPAPRAAPRHPLWLLPKCQAGLEDRARAGRRLHHRAQGKLLQQLGCSNPPRQLAPLQTCDRRPLTQGPSCCPPPPAPTPAGVSVHAPHRAAPGRAGPGGGGAARRVQRAHRRVGSAPSAAGPACAAPPPDCQRQLGCNLSWSCRSPATQARAASAATPSPPTT